MTTQDPELSAALGWPGGVSDPVLARTQLLQMVAALRLTSKQALEALEFLSLDFFMLDPISPGRESTIKAITALRAALAQEQAEPDHETRAELAEQQVVQLAEERDHYRNLWQKAQQDEPAQQVKTCAWRDNLDAIYETECGNLHIVNDGTLEENGMKYCCYCGKEIEDESPK